MKNQPYRILDRLYKVSIAFIWRLVNFKFYVFTFRYKL